MSGWNFAWQLTARYPISIQLEFDPNDRDFIRDLRDYGTHNDYFWLEYVGDVPWYYVHFRDEAGLRRFEKWLDAYN